MARLAAVALILFLGSPTVTGAQSALAYDFTLRESIDGRDSVSVGHITISGSSMRMDVQGRSPFSRVADVDLGDSLSIISTDTGSAQVLSVLNHRKKEYVQFAPAVLTARMRARKAKEPYASRIDFAGSSVRVDSLGPGDTIAGYATVHYRVSVVFRVSIAGNVVGGQDVTADYFVAPALAEFTHAGEILDGLGVQTGFAPGDPKDFLAQLDSARKRVSAALSLRTVTDSKASIFGTGVTRSLTFETANVRRVESAASAFIVPSSYKRVVPRGFESLM